MLILSTKGIKIFFYLFLANQYFEKLLQNVKEETEQKVSEAGSKAINQRLQKLQTRFDRCVKEKQFLEDVSI